MPKRSWGMKAEDYKPCTSTTPNPNPYRFEIIWDTTKSGQPLKTPILACIKYLDCTSFEGQKFIIFRSKLDYLRLIREGFIDPHFDDKGIIVARFNPNESAFAKQCSQLFSAKSHRMI